MLTLARLFRTALQHLGVRGHPKVTGKRGIQVWIHVQPRYTFDETRDWVGELSRASASVVPDLVSWEWGKADRAGRARLDYTQNSLIKTLVAPYAVRPVPGATVSAPITWDELDDPDPAARPLGHRARSSTRVERIGDLFSGVLDDPQELPPLSLVAAVPLDQPRRAMARARKTSAEDDEDDRPQAQDTTNVGAAQLHQARRASGCRRG